MRGTSLREAATEARCVPWGVFLSLGQGRALGNESSPKSKGFPEENPPSRWDQLPARYFSKGADQLERTRNMIRKRFCLETLSLLNASSTTEECYIVLYTAFPVPNKLHQQKHSYSCVTVFTRLFANINVSFKKKITSLLCQQNSLVWNWPETALSGLVYAS